MGQTTLWQTTDTSTPYRIPAITTAKNGDIIAIADYRLEKRDIGYGEVDMYARISTDNGANWSAATCIADGTGNSGFDCGFGDAAVVADRERNEVLVMCVSGKQVFANGTSDAHNHMARIRGTYNETTKAWVWDDPEDVTSIFLNDDNALLPSAYTMFIASGRMLQSSYKAEGKDYYRVYAALLVKDSSSSYKNYVIYSDDFGETWSLLGGAAVTGADEAKVEELPNGNILISSRTKGGRIYNEYTGSWNTSNQKTYTFSSGSEAANGELMLYKGLYKVGETTGLTYDVLLQSLPTASSRGGVTVFYQQVDENSNLSTLTASGAWKTGKVVDSGASCYSTMTIQSNGKIGFLYEDNYTTKSLGLFQGNYDYADIVYIPYDVETLTAGVYTTQAPEVTPDPVAPTFSLSATSATLTAGETMTLTLTTNSDATPTWISSNTAVATVDENGLVTAVAEGTATITVSVAATDSYTAASATCNITVNAAATEEPDPEEPDTPDTPEVETVTITAKSGKIGNSTYYLATFSHEKPMIVPSGVRAYYVKVADGAAVTLTRVASGKVIPAGQGVILISSTTSEFVMTEATDLTNVADLTDNILKPTLSYSTMTFSANDYVLALKGSGDWKGYFAFCYIAAGTVIENYANRAYLTLSTSEANIRMRFDDDATGINSVENDADIAPVYYDLTGRRVANPTKGSIYIVNGKKVLFQVRG